MRTASVRLADLDLNLLVALDTVFTERHVGRAAARLHLTQSAVSNALTRLRRHFNDPLVTRVGGAMTPTALARDAMIRGRRETRPGHPVASVRLVSPSAQFVLNVGV